MDSLLQKLEPDAKGVIEGFDRIVFKGMLKLLLVPGGFARFLRRLSLKHLSCCAVSVSAVEPKNVGT